MKSASIYPSTSTSGGNFLSPQSYQESHTPHSAQQYHQSYQVPQYQSYEQQYQPYASNMDHHNVYQEYSSGYQQPQYYQQPQIMTQPMYEMQSYQQQTPPTPQPQVAYQSSSAANQTWNISQNKSSYIVSKVKCRAIAEHHLSCVANLELTKFIDL